MAGFHLGNVMSLLATPVPLCSFLSFFISPSPDPSNSEIFQILHLREHLHFWVVHITNRIVRNRFTEQFSGLPYIYALSNYLITL
ncbi:hypothetical protein CKAN_02755900 [Cinnamomum micranthum f. kanehirae]|uniref:Uncharacterized protein n=1 Tax=Cinnamomum micranthum f. kanehirae TaxID=337451 RepID=A0A3S3NF21_9MAGN|nr:hypothetical protein CKAN_02755900 [Cinnamomum micranthum f. kanehirae]